MSFDLAESWVARPVLVDGQLDGLVHHAGFTLRCEIDARPAGSVGFLTVWSGGRAGDDPGTALQGFLAADRDLVEIRQRITKAGMLPAAEATFVRETPSIGSRKQERVLAVTVPTGVLVLSLGGVDTAQHERMLPAYLLAKHTIDTATS